MPPLCRLTPSPCAQKKPSPGAPQALASKIRRNVEYLWNLHHGLDVQSTLAELPGNLRTEVLMQLQVRGGAPRTEVEGASGLAAGGSLLPKQKLRLEGGASLHPAGGDGAEREPVRPLRPRLHQEHRCPAEAAGARSLLFSRCVRPCLRIAEDPELRGLGAAASS